MLNIKAPTLWEFRFRGFRGSRGFRGCRGFGFGKLDFGNHRAMSNTQSISLPPKRNPYRRKPL